MTNFIYKELEEAFSLHSRVHPLHNFSKWGNWHVKRDDELGFLQSGSKIRKYSSLLFHLKTLQIKKVALVGSESSNHLIGFIPLLIENSIDYELYLLKSSQTVIEGNRLWLHLLSQEKNITYLSRDEWKYKEDFIASKQKGGTFYIPEGGDHPFSLAGAMTVGEDLLRNEKDLGFSFDHIFIDAGTGLTAIALLLSLGLHKKKPHIHIIMMTKDQKNFENKLLDYKSYLEKKIKIKIEIPQYTLYSSLLAPSFGAVNKKIFSYIKTLFREEGILIDPIYGAKLFYTAQQLSFRLSLKGNCLCIHSGGALSLMGFQKDLSMLLKK